MIPIEHYIYLSLTLFVIGLMVIVIKKNAIVVLMGIELMLNAANINLIAFSQYDTKMQGQMFSLFVIIIAAAEAAVALAIVLRVYSYYTTANLDEISEISDNLK